MKKNYTILFLSLLTSFYVHAQFPQNANQTFFVCDTINVQNGVQAFADDKGGTYSFWVDNRNGSSNSSIYGQHLDSLGSPQWVVNGKLFDNSNGKGIWNMAAVKWQSGFLIAWVQGISGGDTLFCNYYDLNGNSLWAQPTLVANRQMPNIIYVNYDNLNIYPTSIGATLTFGLTQNGGSDFFSFNRIDFSGKLSWPLDTFLYSVGNGSYFVTGNDHHDGFYVAASTGGLGSPLYVKHFDANGVSTISAAVNVSTVAGGRGDDKWNVLCDTTGTAYIVWDDATYNEVHIAKVRRDGTLPWGGGGDKTICNAAGSRIQSYAIIYGDTIYALWDDARPGSANQFSIYMQKLDTAGNTYWTPNGIQLSTLSAYLPYPKLVKTGTDVVAALELNISFSAQKIRPDSTSVWPQNGIQINNNDINIPFYGDYVLVTTGLANVTAIWSNNDNVMAARIRPDGTLTHVAQLNEKSMSLYPNPVTDNFTIRLEQYSPSNITVNVYNSLGEMVQQKQFAENNDGYLNMETNNLSAGIYVVKVNDGNYYSSSKICVIK